MSTSTTRIVVILKDYKDQKNQIEVIKTVVLKYDVQKYYNPSIRREELLVYEEPKRPKLVDVNVNTQTYAILKEDEKEIYRSLLKDYQRVRRRFDQQVNVLADLRKQIQETVYINNLNYTFGYNIVYNILVKLKARFLLLDKEREQELITE